MKKKLSIVILLAIVAAMILPVTFAWFSDKSTSDIGITSYVHKSYFESGDGSSDEQYAGNEEELGYDDDGCAYEIKYPVQFYYFSWLQYLGYFNQAVTETTTINQKYFYLSDDLDMTGWVLPPVGTAEFPFLGHFDGNGHTISNLTVQNVASTNLVSTTTLSDVPETIGTVEVVGLFGVVGSTENDGTVKAAVENEGLFTPSDDDYTYNHANNVIKNFKLTDVTLKADAATHNALIGAVAGYLNATVAHADVTAATLCVANGTSAAMSKTNISDYSVIGYNAQAPSASATAYIELAAPTIDNTNTIATAISGGGGSESGDDWGGSIDFKTLHERLHVVCGSAAANTKYAYSVNDMALYLTKSATGNPTTTSVIYRYRINGKNDFTSGGTQGTYIPINMDNSYNADAYKNTGYIIGSSIGSSNNASPRSSSYYMDYIANSLSDTAVNYTKVQNGTQAKYNSSKLEILTYSQTDGAWRRISDDYNASNSNVNTALSGYTKKTVDELGLQKYNTEGSLTGARDNLHDIFTQLDGSSSENFIHGIHFDTNAVSKNVTTTIPSAKILGTTYTNYAMPQGCIDFRLKEDGYINFFAGTYYSMSPTQAGYLQNGQTYGDKGKYTYDGSSSDVTAAYFADGDGVSSVTVRPGSKSFTVTKQNYFHDSFFSLNVVVRNGSGTITDIKKISKIYTNPNKVSDDDGLDRYVYQYDGDGVPTGCSNSNLLFDTSILTNQGPVVLALYYFEIPVNGGSSWEYALGAAKNTGTRGAYLIYLDIGTSGGGETQTVVPGTSIVETQTRTTYNYQYVSGVGVTAAENTPNGVRAETITSPTAAVTSKTVSVAGMTADNVFILPTTDTVTDSAAVVKYLGKTEVITQRTIMTGTVNDVDTTIIVTKTTTKTYDASDVLISTVNTISATNNGEATETPSGFAASTLVKPATAVQYHFYDPGGITVSFTTDAEIVESAISLTEYSATVTGGSVTVFVDTVPAGKTLRINGTPVSAGNKLTTPAP